MSLLFETIKVQDGTLQNLQYHQERMNSAMQILFPGAETIHLDAEISVPEYALNGLFKCRVDYDEKICNVQFSVYTKREISVVHLVKDDTIEYNFKFSDRKRFDELKISVGAEEILIVKNDLITDTSFSNIAFYDGKEWFTPATPLLSGTKRRQLIGQNVLKEANIKPADINYFKSFILINAMLEFNPLYAMNVNCIHPLP